MIHLDKNVNEIIAKLDEVQDVIAHETREAALRAKQNLSEHRHDGHAEIQYDTDGVDGYVHLSDERGLGVAMSIEFGRTPETNNPRGPSTPTAVLHDAFGQAIRKRRRFREIDWQRKRRKRRRR